MVNLVFGVWLANSFGLQIAALAGASVVIGLSELSGEGLVALTTDRLGKPRALAIGLTGNIIASLLLPFIGRTETGALIGLFLFYISFEYTVVSQFPLMTESVPQARATVMALNLVGFGMGRSLGSLLSTFIYFKVGIPVGHPDCDPVQSLRTVGIGRGAKKDQPAAVLYGLAQTDFSGRLI